MLVCDCTAASYKVVTDQVRVGMQGPGTFTVQSPSCGSYGASTPTLCGANTLQLVEVSS